MYTNICLRPFARSGGNGTGSFVWTFRLRDGTIEIRLIVERCEVLRSICEYRVIALAVGVIAALAGNAFSATFLSSTPIVIPGPGSSTGTSILVSGQGTSIVSIAVEIEGFTETHPDDVGLVLVGPTGAALALLGDGGGNTSVTNLNVTFSDTAASLVPQNTPLVAGSFKPSQYASLGSFPSPGPGVAYSSPAVFGTSTFTTTFQGKNPNGSWSLYTIDPVSGDTGEISLGWNVQITAVPEPASLSLIAVAGTGLACGRRRRVLRD